MADYTPVYIEGEIITLTPSAPCKGGDLLVVTGVNQVAPFTPSATPALNFVGVASSDAATSSRVSFYCRGPVHESVADGTVTAGDQITTAVNPNRQVKTLIPSALDLGAAFSQVPDNLAVNAGINNARSVIGVALTTATDGNKVRWMMLV